MMPLLLRMGTFVGTGGVRQYVRLRYVLVDRLSHFCHGRSTAWGLGMEVYRFDLIATVYHIYSQTHLCSRGSPLVKCINHVSACISCNQCYQLTSQLSNAARVISKWVYRDPAITTSRGQSYFGYGLALKDKKPLCPSRLIPLNGGFYPRTPFA